MSDPRIVRIEYEMPRAKPAGFADPMPRIHATFDDGSRKELFDVYPNEIAFGEGELVGLTEEQARSLKSSPIRVLRDLSGLPRAIADLE